jgi:hypothetical protein
MILWKTFLKPPSPVAQLPAIPLATAVAMVPYRDTQQDPLEMVGDKLFTNVARYFLMLGRFNTRFKFFIFLNFYC